MTGTSQPINYHGPEHEAQSDGQRSERLDCTMRPPPARGSLQSLVGRHRQARGFPGRDRRLVFSRVIRPPVELASLQATLSNRLGGGSMARKPSPDDHSAPIADRSLLGTAGLDVADLSVRTGMGSCGVASTDVQDDSSVDCGRRRSWLSLASAR